MYFESSVMPKDCFTLIERPFDRAFLLWVTERRGCEADRRQISHRITPNIRKAHWPGG